MAEQPSQGSNIRASQNRNVKRSFPRPAASSIMNLDNNDPISLGNTFSTAGNRAELLVAGKD